MLDISNTVRTRMQARAGVGVSDVAAEERRGRGALPLKDVFDRVVVVLALPAVLPVMLLIAIAIRLDSRGPVLFRQPRLGKDGQTILVHKFRTMRHDRTDLTGGRQASRDDDRVTRVGRVLRRSCLDELPQLWDVLRGRMSLVGPRPHPVGMKIGDMPINLCIPRYHDRLRMKPGVTGLAQVLGNRGPVVSVEMGRERIELDNHYIESWTFQRDIAILFGTVGILFKDGSY